PTATTGSAAISWREPQAVDALRAADDHRGSVESERGLHALAGQRQLVQDAAVGVQQIERAVGGRGEEAVAGGGGGGDDRPSRLGLEARRARGGVEPVD